jgi:nitroreductase
MLEHADLLRVIPDRHSVRRYTDQPIDTDTRAALAEVIEACNAASGLSIQAVYDEPEAFGGRKSHYGSFRDVRNYFAVVGPDKPELSELAGYWGERVVLAAQALGLNTCWVAVTYSRSRSAAELGAGEKESLVIAVGYGEAPGKPHKVKPIESLGRVKGDGAWPDWFRAGVAAAQLAPTAMNQQRFTFELDGNVVHADPGFGPYTRIDLGIAKSHFDLAAKNLSEYSWSK